MAHNKRLAASYAAIDRARLYTLDEAIEVVKGNAKAKFDETVEFSMNLGIDPRHADQMVRGMINLPNGTGKTLRVGVFARTREGAGSAGRRGGRGRRRGSGGEGPGRRDRVRALHRHARHDGAGGAAG